MADKENIFGYKDKETIYASILIKRKFSDLKFTFSACFVYKLSFLTCKFSFKPTVISKVFERKTGRHAI